MGGTIIPDEKKKRERDDFASPLDEGREISRRKDKRSLFGPEKLTMRRKNAVKSFAKIRRHVFSANEK